MNIKTPWILLHVSQVLGCLSFAGTVYICMCNVCWLSHNSILAWLNHNPNQANENKLSHEMNLYAPFLSRPKDKNQILKRQGDNEKEGLIWLLLLIQVVVYILWLNYSNNYIITIPYPISLSIFLHLDIFSQFSFLKSLSPLPAQYFRFSLSL